MFSHRLPHSCHCSPQSLTKTTNPYRQKLRKNSLTLEASWKICLSLSVSFTFSTVTVTATAYKEGMSNSSNSYACMHKIVAVFPLLGWSTECKRHEKAGEMENSLI